MLKEQLKYVFDQFDHNGEFESFQELASGHINDTYLIRTKTKPYFVLQRINHAVFKDAPGLIENKFLISLHIQNKLRNLPQKKRYRRVLSFVKTPSGTSYYRDGSGNYWNLMYYIDKSLTIDRVTSKEIAYQGGKMFGTFLMLTADFDASRLTEVVPNFHNISFRYSEFDKALEKAPKVRLEKAKDYIEKAKALRTEMHLLKNLKDSGKIPIRVTHNDTKISNALFNKKNKGLCVIDTDTIMPGIVHYDFGDAIRTVCNNAYEDETNLDLVEFNMDYYKAYTKGFLNKMRGTLSSLELSYLPLGAKTMIFIMALRFLTDYLNGDVYYKTKYPEHNLDRSKNQFRLLQSFTEKMVKMA